MAYDVEQRVLVVPPTTRDGEVTRSLLDQAGLAAVICTDLPDLCIEIRAGAGAMLLTGDALAAQGVDELASTLRQQPSWSDLPVVVLLHGGHQATTPHRVLQSFGNVTLLERPAPARSVVSALQTAVRSRQRQYQIRDYIAESVRAQARAQELQEKLAVALQAERTARSEAERVSQIKDEFLATLSHELRTPLNAIFGWAQLLKMMPYDQAAAQEGIEVIDRNVRLQTQLIDDLLDMSRIISGKMRLEVQDVSLSELINAAIDSVRPAAEAKQLQLEVELEPDAGHTIGDPGRLQQVFWNLLCNAIKFTPPGGKIKAVMQQSRSIVEVRVVDSGQGIHPDFLPHLFERFSQADASTTRKHGGLGLGLSIVKNLVELHGGTVHAESCGAGQGATFIVQLPVPLSKTTHHATPAASGAVSADFALRDKLVGLKVLVVDDDADAREFIHRFLAECGATAALAASSAEAQSLMATFRPDVIISDIGMPDQDGYDFIRAVRSRGHQTPAVALTAFARSSDRLRSLQAGYQSHLPKPVAPAELVAVVASLAGRF